MSTPDIHLLQEEVRKRSGEAGPRRNGAGLLEL